MDVFPCKVWVERQYEGKIVSHLFVIGIIKHESHQLLFSLWLQAIGSNSLPGSFNEIPKSRNRRQITAQNLQLEPLCGEVIRFHFLYRSPLYGIGVFSWCKQVLLVMYPE